jgi:hypothetical protein
MKKLTDYELSLARAAIDILKKQMKESNRIMDEKGGGNAGPEYHQARVEACRMGIDLLEDVLAGK